MISTQTPTFGLLLKQSRRAAGMTQEELAEKSGLSVRGISDLERGVRQPRKDTVQLLLAALRLEGEALAPLKAAARAQTSTPHGTGSGMDVAATSGSYFLAPPAGPLVSRRREFNRVVAAVDAVAAGSGRLVLLTGEPGIGKTRIAQEVALRAATGGALVAGGRCYESDQDVAFYPFLDVLATAYAASPDSVRDDVPSRWPYLAWLLPEDLLQVPAPARNAVATGLGEEQRFFWTVNGFLRAVAEWTPVVVLLDDLHWADAASLKLLLYLARHSRNSRVLLLGTYRDVELGPGHPLARALVDLNRERLIERVSIHRLDERATEELIVSVMGEIDLPPRVIALVQRATEGNPFFIQEVLRALVDRGDIYWGDGRWRCRDINELLTPPTVLAAIAERVVRLPTEAQAVLYRASVLGQTFDFDVLRSLGNSSEEDLEDALQSAVSAGLIREEGANEYAFSHALTQQALYDELSTRRRRNLHLAAAEALQRVPDRVRQRRSAELARHFREGGDVARAVTYSMMAGDQAADIFAYGDAERLYRHALEVLSGEELEANDVHLRSRALLKLGRILDMTEQYEGALTTLEQAAQLCKLAHDVTGEAAAVSEIGWIHHNRGTDAEGITRVQPVVAALESLVTISDPKSLAALHTALSRLFFGLGRFSDELHSAERAAELARQAQDRMVLAVAEARRGAALMTMAGRREEAMRALDVAIALAGETGNLGTMTVALSNLGRMSIERGEYRRARRTYEQAVEAAKRTELPGRLAWTLTRLGYVHFLQGEWSSARSLYEESLRLLGDDFRAAAHARLRLGEVDLLEGAWDTGCSLVEEAIAVETAGQDVWLQGIGQRLLAEKDLLDDRPGPALDRVAPYIDHPPSWLPLGSITSTLLFAPVACAHVKLNHELEADAILAEGFERARRQDHGMARTDLLVGLATLRASQGRLPEAWTALEEAVTLARTMPDPYREVRALAEAGSLAVGEDNVVRARASLQDGLATAERLGCRPYVRVIQRSLSRLTVS